MRLHPDVGILLVALLGVAGLTLAADALEPPRIAIADAPSHEGARVALDARVLDATHGARGRFLVLADKAHRLHALAGPGEGPAPGDRVLVVGIVQRSGGAWALSVDRIDVLERAATRAVSPADLAREPAAYEGARVLVRGEARGDALVGEGARVRIGGDGPPGDGWWLAAGTFAYRARDASYVLWVDTWTRPP